MSIKVNQTLPFKIQNLTFSFGVGGTVGPTNYRISAQILFAAGSPSVKYGLNAHIKLIILDYISNSHVYVGFSKKSHLTEQ
jgi:hypothetical protein